MIAIDVKIVTDLDPMEAILADLAGRTARDFLEAGYARDYDIVGKPLDIAVVMGGPEQCEAWDVRPDALGFFPVISFERHEGDGEDGDGEGYYELPDGFEVHVNVKAGSALLRETLAGASDTDAEAEIEAWLVTVAHEMLHALDWIRETGGKTPDEVYVEDRGGTVAIEAVHKAIADRHALESGGSTEDAVEALARDIVGRLTYGSLEEARERLVAAMPPSPRR